MTTDPIDRVFGRERLKMATGAHVEVFREAAAPGESRRYTKRFLTTADGDYAQWTEREWRILARLIGHGSRSVPEIVQYDRDARGTKLVQTYDAGATVDQWATLLPVARDRRVHAHVFEDCAHWWALAHHCLVALDEIHTLGLVHLDVKGDNVCIPIDPPDFDPAAGTRLFPVFRKLALIDFAFSLVSGEELATALPIGWQQDYDYQSPRLLHALDAGRAGDLRPTELLDWRCDMYSLAAMLKRYLPREAILYDIDRGSGWTRERYDAAKALILRLRDAHDRDGGARPHVELMLETSAQLANDELRRSLEEGWTLAMDVQPRVSALPLTPVTRLAPPLSIVVPPREERDLSIPTTLVVPLRTAVATPPVPPRERRPTAFVAVLVLALVALSVGAWHEGGLPGAIERFADAGRAGRPALPDAAKDEEVSTPPVTSAEATSNDAAETVATAREPATATPSETATNAPVAVASGDAIADRALRATPSTPPPSLAEQIEAYRSKPLAHSSPRAPPVPRSRVAARDDAARKGANAAAARTARAPVAQANARPQTHAAKRSAGATSVAARSSPSAPRIASAPASVSATTTVFAPAPPVVATPSDPAPPSPSRESSASLPAPTPPVAAAVPAPAQPQAAPPVAPQVAIAPTPPPTQAVAPRATTPGHAPIVEASRTFSAALPAPRLATPPVVAEPERATARAVDPQREAPLATHAAALLNDAVPRSAAQSYARVGRVLAMAATSWHAADEASLANAAVRARGGGEQVAGATGAAAGEARRLHEQARQAFATRRHMPEALAHALNAFAADPNDPEISTQLAFLYLRVMPAQPERARQLALHALGARAVFDASARVQDWITFAVASALTGRTADARNAFFTALALSRDAERTCNAATYAYAIHGERLRDAVDALAARVRMQGRGGDVPDCGYSASRMASSR